MCVEKFNLQSVFAIVVKSSKGNESWNNGHNLRKKGCKYSKYIEFFTIPTPSNWNKYPGEVPCHELLAEGGHFLLQEKQESLGERPDHGDDEEVVHEEGPEAAGSLWHVLSICQHGHKVETNEGDAKVDQDPALLSFMQLPVGIIFFC